MVSHVHSEKQNPGEINTSKLYRTRVDLFGFIAMILLLVCSMALFIQLMATGMLTDLWAVLTMVVLVVINAAHVIVQLPLRYNKIGKLVCGILAVIISAVMIFGLIATGSVKNMIAKISGKLIEKEVTAVIVMEDDPALTLGAAGDYVFGYLNNADEELTEGMLNEMANDLGHQVKTVGYDSTTTLVDALYDDEVGAIILNEGYIPVLENTDEYADFSSQTRIIYEYSVEREIDNPSLTNIDLSRPFVVYCSGIDARDSDVNIKSKSDVNILAVINPQTHQILLINTPRDSYLPLAFNGELDKLTHAGLYGINESMNVLGNLYGVDVAYYVRVNFDGLVDIVDALGGIDVMSEYEFTSKRMEIPNEDGTGYYFDSYSFSEGMNHLDGRAALAFSRERYSFAAGDIQRGKNQMAVIKAIVNKATSSSALSNYQKVLNAVSDAFITNMSYDDIAGLVKLQQKNMTGWNITSYSVYGDGGIDYTYSGGEAYVMYPDYDLVNNAQNLIQAVFNGEVPQVPED